VFSRQPEYQSSGKPDRHPPEARFVPGDIYLEACGADRNEPVSAARVACM
jgi:hypothetical protein